MVQNEPRSMSLEGFPDLTGFVRFCPDFADFADLTGQIRFFYFLSYEKDKFFIFIFS